MLFTGLTLKSHTVQNHSKRRSLSCILSDRRESLKIKAMVSLCNEIACITIQYVPGEHLPVSPGSVLIPVEWSMESFLDEKGTNKSQKRREPRCQSFQKSGLSQLSRWNSSSENNWFGFCESARTLLGIAEELCQDPDKGQIKVKDTKGKWVRNREACGS